MTCLSLAALLAGGCADPPAKCNESRVRAHDAWATALEPTHEALVAVNAFADALDRRWARELLQASYQLESEIERAQHDFQAAGTSALAPAIDARKAAHNAADLSALTAAQGRLQIAWTDVQAVLLVRRDQDEHQERLRALLQAVDALSIDEAVKASEESFERCKGVDP